MEMFGGEKKSRKVKWLKLSKDLRKSESRVVLGNPERVGAWRKH